jgi:hypothetical protein
MYCGDKTAEEGSVMGYIYSALYKQLTERGLGQICTRTPNPSIFVLGNS